MGADVDIFDSNVWALGFTEQNPVCTDRIEDVRSGDKLVGINAYLYREIDQIFDDVVADPKRRDLTKQNFARFVHSCEHVSVADPGEVESLSLGQVRSASSTKLIAQLNECDVDDVPILLLAWELITDGGVSEVTIHSLDASFVRAIRKSDRLPRISAAQIPQSDR